MGKHYVAVRSGSLESSETLSDVTCAIHPCYFNSMPLVSCRRRHGRVPRACWAYDIISFPGLQVRRLFPHIWQSFVSPIRVLVVGASFARFSVACDLNYKFLVTCVIRYLSYCFRIRRSHVKVDLGSRGLSWLASPDEYRLCNSRSIPKPSFVVIHSECPGSTADTNSASVYGAFEEVQTASTW